MAATVDFVHDAELADAILGRLRNATDGLPASWRDEDNPLFGLKRIEFGALGEWRYSGEVGDGDVGDLIPSILVRFATSDEDPGFSLIGGKEGRRTVFTVVHLFGEQQCVDSADASLPVQVQRARAQKAKLISKAIWGSTTNVNRRRLDQPTLTTTDTDAHVIVALPGPVLYYPPENVGSLYAVGLVVNVETLTK